MLSAFLLGCMYILAQVQGKVMHFELDRGHSVPFSYLCIALDREWYKVLFGMIVVWIRG